MQKYIRRFTCTFEKSIKARNCSFLLSVRGNDKSPAQTRIHHFSRISSPFSRRSPPFLSGRAHIEEAEGIQRRQFTTVAVRATNWFHRISRAHSVTRPTAPFVPFGFFLCLLLHFLLLFLLSYSHQDETERNPAQRPALPFACIAKKGGSVLDNYCAHSSCVEREGRRWSTKGKTEREKERDKRK